MDVDLSADGLRYVVQIWLVPTGHNDVRETSTVGCKQLLLNATDGEDLGEDWPTGEQTGERSHIRGWQQLSTHRRAPPPQVVACRRPFRAMCVRAPADRRRLGPRHGAATSCWCPQAPGRLCRFSGRRERAFRGYRRSPVVDALQRLAPWAAV